MIRSCLHVFCKLCLTDPILENCPECQHDFRAEELFPSQRETIILHLYHRILGVNQSSGEYSTLRNRKDFGLKKREGFATERSSLIPDEISSFDPPHTTGGPQSELLELRKKAFESHNLALLAFSCNVPVTTFNFVNELSYRSLGDWILNSRHDSSLEYIKRELVDQFRNRFSFPIHFKVINAPNFASHSNPIHAYIWEKSRVDHFSSQVYSTLPSDLLAFLSLLKEQLTCTSCFKLYKNPRVISSCLHVFCKGCLEGFKNPECPTCRRTFSSEVLRQDEREIRLIVLYKLAKRQLKEIQGDHQLDEKAKWQLIDGLSFHIRYGQVNMLMDFHNKKLTALSEDQYYRLEEAFRLLKRNFRRNHNINTLEKQRFFYQIIFDFYEKNYNFQLAKYRRSKILKKCFSQTLGRVAPLDVLQKVRKIALRNNDRELLALSLYHPEITSEYIKEAYFPQLSDWVKSYPKPPKLVELTRQMIDLLVKKLEEIADPQSYLLYAGMLFGDLTTLNYHNPNLGHLFEKYFQILKSKQFNVNFNFPFPEGFKIRCNYEIKDYDFEFFHLMVTALKDERLNEGLALKYVERVVALYRHYQSDKEITNEFPNIESLIANMVPEAIRERAREAFFVHS